MLPIIKFPLEMLGTSRHVQIYSFSGSMLVSKECDLTSVQFLCSSVECFITPPFRLAHSTWRPIPQLNDKNIELAFGDKLEGLPLQVAVRQSLATEEGATLTFCGSRGNDYDPTLPPDSVALIAPGQNLESVLHELGKQFIPRLVSWLRVSTKQWWIGQATELLTGNLHFELDIGPQGQLAPLCAPRSRQATAPLDMKEINQEIWLNAVSRSAKGEEPQWVDVMRCDIYSAYHNADYRMAILLTCCWVELLRDEILDLANKRLSDLKTSSTDLLKHVSVGFGRLFQYDMSIERPEEFAFLGACWVARGDLAHGRPLSWKLNATRNFGDMPAAEFYDRMDAIEAWISWLGALVKASRT